MSSGGSRCRRTLKQEPARLQGLARTRTADPFIRSDVLPMPLATTRIADLQGFPRPGSRRADSNRGPLHYECVPTYRHSSAEQDVSALQAGNRRQASLFVSACFGGFCCPRVAPEIRLRQILVEQVNIGAEREAGVRVTEEDLHLLRVPATPGASRCRRTARGDHRFGRIEPLSGTRRQPGAGCREFPS